MIGPGGYSHTLPIRVCAAQRRRDFEAPGLERGIHFRGDAVLEDFRGKDCAFVANWLRGKGLNKLCAVFEVFKF